MEDKQIIELYWERSRDAIMETKDKYEDICTYIVSHILQNAEAVEVCVNQSYEKLWENIPPRRPQNLKNYLCKITRNLALQIKYPDVLETEMDLFSAELVIYDFLKALEPMERKLFVAHYWCFAPVSEIAMQNKMSQKKVYAILDALRQKLEIQLEQKNIQLKNEAEWFYAMTEIEDRYLEEALPQMCANEETEDGQNPKQTDLLLQIWKKYQIAIIACAIGLLFVIFIWPKNPSNVNPTEGLSGTEDTNGENNQNIPVINIDLENLVTVYGSGSYLKDELVELKEMIPWKEEMSITALPVYYNLSFDDENSSTVYMDEGAIIQKVTDIACKLDMNIINTIIDTVNTNDREKPYVARSIEAVTDRGTIKIDARGKITVSYDRKVQLLNTYEMSDSASIKDANTNAGRLMMEFGGVMGVEHFDTISYPQYTADGKRTMNYRVVVADLYRKDVAQILNYAFNTIEFYYEESIGLTGFSYGDIRFTTEEMGYYPIISLEEAKKQLLNGNYICEKTDMQLNGMLLSEDVLGVELTYKTDEWVRCYQPYYCFYIYMEQAQSYVRFYVPAVEGASAYNTLPPEPEFKIIDHSGYQSVTTMGYEKDGKYYSIINGELQEVQELELFNDYYKYGDVWGDMNPDEIVYYFEYGDSISLNLTEIVKELVPDKNYDSFDAMYIDDKILIIGWEYSDNADEPYYATHYLYSIEKNTLTQIMERTPRYVESKFPNGMTYYGGRYATNRNTDGMLWTIELISGKGVNTGIRNDDIKLITNASSDHYVVVLWSGEMLVVEKASGEVIKKAKYHLSDTLMSNPYISIHYKDELLYLEPAGSFIYVFSEFED